MLKILLPWRNISKNEYRIDLRRRTLEGAARGQVYTFHGILIGCPHNCRKHITGKLGERGRLMKYVDSCIKNEGYYYLL